MIYWIDMMSLRSKKESGEGLEERKTSLTRTSKRERQLDGHLKGGRRMGVVKGDWRVNGSRRDRDRDG